MIKDVSLRKGKDKITASRHPWLFSGALYDKKIDAQRGDLVRLHSSEGEILGYGHYATGSIAVRMLHWGAEWPVDFWMKTIHAAIELRIKLGIYGEETNCMRLIHGEGDGLPGLIVDYYNGTAVVQCHSYGMYCSRVAIKDALLSQPLLPITAIFLSAEQTLQHIEEAEIQNQWLHGKSGDILVEEQGVEFEVDVMHGQKTGFFLDQRENRALLATLCKNKTVLNTFCYTGGFSLYALKHGASHVCSMDSSRTAMALLEKNLRLNHVDDRHESQTVDVLKALPEMKDSYDIVILDPPAFAKSRRKRHNAVQAYKRLNVMGMNSVKSGGLIMSFSCSQVVDEQLFLDTIVSAGLDCGKDIQILRQLSQGMDHPRNLYHSEGKYLKGLLLKVN